MKQHYLKITIYLIAATLFTSAVWYLYYKNYFGGLVLNDAMDYAGIARNVARGQGFISQYITPLALAHHGVPQPDMWRAPLWPLALAAFQKVFGFIDEASAMGTGFFFILTAPVIFLLARQWFGTLAGAGAVLIYALTPELLKYSISGMTEPMAVFMMSAVLLPATAKPLKNNSGDWISGITLGLFYLTRYNALTFLPSFLAFRWFFRRRGLRPPLQMLAGFILAALPWMIRNTVIFGNPLFSLQKYEPVMFTSIFPDYSLYLYPIKVNVQEIIKTHPQALLEKIGANLESFASYFFSPTLNGVSAVIFVIFLISLFLPLGKKTAGVKPLVISCFLIQLAALLVIHFIPRLFLIFTPLYIIFALGSLITLLKTPAVKSRLLRCLPVLATAAVVISLTYFNFTGQDPIKKVPSERGPYLGVINELANSVPAGKVILTDMGHMVSWYGDRYACKIPYSVAMIPEIKKRADIGAVFISDRILWHMPEADRSWKLLWYQRPAGLYGLQFSKSLDTGIIYY